MPQRPSRNGPEPLADKHPIDQHVGARVRFRRSMLGMSQERLAEALGITFQQVQKYERGLNRISASRLYEISRVLGVPITFFFDGADGSTEIAAPAADGEDGPVMIGRDSDLSLRALRLLQAYNTIEDATLQTALLNLVKSVATYGRESVANDAS